MWGQPPSAVQSSEARPLSLLSSPNDLCLAERSREEKCLHVATPCKVAKTFNLDKASDSELQPH